MGSLQTFLVSLKVEDNLLVQYSVGPNENPLCIYGDPGYPLRIQLQATYNKRNALNPAQREFNTAMSKARISVEWVFGEILRYFAFLDFKKNLKIPFNAVL